MCSKDDLRSNCTWGISTESANSDGLLLSTWLTTCCGAVVVTFCDSDHATSAARHRLSDGEMLTTNDLMLSIIAQYDDH